MFMKKANKPLNEEAGRAASKSADVIKSLVGEGYRLTSQRRVVIDILLRHFGQYLDGDTIYGLAKQDYPNIGIATVYRSLTLFKRLNFLSVISTNEGNRYLFQFDQQKKCLLICRKCGRIQEYSDMAEWMKRFLAQNSFLPEEVNIYGTCGRCSGKN
jgi:Fur family ferric uptake transcriptional regulator